jgi:hypothetical protein
VLDSPFRQTFVRARVDGALSPSSHLEEHLMGMKPSRGARLRSISPLLVALACLLVPARLLATELLVPETYATIQAALDVAVAGDVVSVAPGLYPENVC